MLRQRFRALAAVRPVRAHEARVAHALGRLHDLLDLGVRVGDEAVDGHHRRHAELVHVLDVAARLSQPLGDGGDVLVALRSSLRDAAVHLERAYGGDDHCRGRCEPRLAA